MADAQRLYRCLACEETVSGCLKGDKLNICRFCEEKGCKYRSVKKKTENGRRFICIKCDKK